MPVHDSIVNRLSRNNLQEAEVTTNEESVGSKLLREADVFVGGTLSGLKTGLEDRLVHPLNTAGEFAIGYGAARGLALLERKAGFAGLAAQAVTLTLTYVACKDAIHATNSAGVIWSESWDSPINSDKNRALVANGFGGYLVESAVSGYGALRGAKAGYLKNQSKLVVDELFAGNPKDAGVAAVVVGDGRGSGFAIDPYRIVTNKHVAIAGGGGVGSSLTVKTGRDSFYARVTALHENADLAILTTLQPHGLTPLKLASEDKVLTAGTELVALKRGFTGQVQAAPGPFEATGTSAEMNERVWDSLNIFQKSENKVKSVLMRALRGPSNLTVSRDREVLLSRLMGAGHGWSGSPLLNRETGEVVGVVAGGFYNPKLRRPASSESLKNLRELIAQTGS